MFSGLPIVLVGVVFLYTFFSLFFPALSSGDRGERGFKGEKGDRGDRGEKTGKR